MGRERRGGGRGRREGDGQEVERHRLVRELVQEGRDDVDGAVGDEERAGDAGALRVVLDGERAVHPLRVCAEAGEWGVDDPV